MAYLSRIWLNPLRTGAQRLLRNPQALHATVLGGLSSQPVSERVLWRLETPTPFRAELLVLTQTSPSWEHLLEQAGWPSAQEPQAVTKSYAPLLDTVVSGREFAFRLRANPISSTRTPNSPSAVQKERLAGDRPRGVLVPHRTVPAQLAWLTEHLPRWGFTVLTTHTDEPDIILTSRERLSFRRGQGDGRSGKVVLQTATFEGRVQVADAETARLSVQQGVGRGRAYGCGLLTLAPPSLRN